MHTRRHILSLAVIALALAGCAGPRQLSEGEYLLRESKVTVTGATELSPSDFSDYVKQHPSFMRKVIYDPELVQPSIEGIERHLEYLGYYGSQVSSSVSVRRGKVSVGYVVAPGKRISIDSIRFSLPSRADFTADFMADTANILVRRGDFLSEAVMEQEIERGAAHFRKLGYYSLSKNNYAFEADTLSVPGSLILDMRLSEFSRNESAATAVPLRKFFIDKVSISYPSRIHLRKGLLQDLNLIHPGELYNEQKVNNTYSRLSSLRMFNSVSIGTSQTDTNLVSCDIRLQQSSLQGFKANIEASTNSNGLMGISPQLTVYHKNIFGGGEWLNLGFMGNFQFMLDQSTRANEFGVSAGLTFPKFLGIPYNDRDVNLPSTELNLSYNYQDRPEYTRSIISTSLGYSGTVSGKKFSYQFYPLQFNMVRLYNITSEFSSTMDKNPIMRYSYQNHFDSGSGGTVYYSSVADNASGKRPFHYVRLSVDVAGNFISLFKPLMRTDESGNGLVFNVPFSQYVRGELNLGKTWRWGENFSHALATRIVAGAGVAYGNSTVLPFEKQFYCGGANSMRGWQARSLGPGTSPLDETFSIPSQTGDVKFEANIEYRFPVVWKLAGALFVDAGNVWNTHEGFGNLAESIAVDWGLGARIDLNFIVLRIDMGLKLHDPAALSSDGSYTPAWLSPSNWLSRDGFALHFGVGYPF
jgi:outer membrane protein assembly factor BamA